MQLQPQESGKPQLQGILPRKVWLGASNLLFILKTKANKAQEIIPTSNLRHTTKIVNSLKQKAHNPKAIKRQHEAITFLGAYNQFLALLYPQDMELQSLPGIPKKQEALEGHIPTQYFISQWPGERRIFISSFTSKHTQSCY